MPFETNGYRPRTFEEILQPFTDGINAQFNKSYDTTTIVGTNYYKYGYTAMQLVMQAEAETAELGAKMQDYIRMANEKINLPKSTVEGFIRAIKDELGYDSTIKNLTISAEAGHMFLVVDLDSSANTKATGSVEITNYGNLTIGPNDDVIIGGVTFTAQGGVVVEGDPTFRANTNNDTTATSLAAQINAHATAGALVEATAVGAIVNLEARNGGEGGNLITIAYSDNNGDIGATVSGATLTGGIDDPEYSTIKQSIIDLMHAYLTAGLFYEGTQTGEKIALNGQTFNYAYELPALVDILVRITVTVSANALTPIFNEIQIRDIFDENFAALYRLGLDFEPEKYLEIARDLPFASDILLEYSEDDGATWDFEPRTMPYNEKINITDPAEIIIVT